MRIDTPVAAHMLTRRPTLDARSAKVVVKDGVKATPPRANAEIIDARKAAQLATLKDGGKTTDATLPPPGKPPADDTAAAQGPSGGMPPGLTLEGLRREWGQTDSPYDLNRDKVVDVDDLIQFLLNYQTQTPQAEVTPDAEPAAPMAQAVPIAEPITPAGPATNDDQGDLVDGVRRTWGSTRSPYDLNNDQVVDVDDLIHALLNWPGSSSAPATDASPPDQSRSNRPAATPVEGPSLADATRSSEASARATRTLLDRLAASGFDRRLPTNVDQLLERLDVTDDERREIARSLYERFPAGMGLNVEA